MASTFNLAADFKTKNLEGMRPGVVQPTSTSLPNLIPFVISGLSFVAMVKLFNFKDFIAMFLTLLFLFVFLNRIALMRMYGEYRLLK